ncbi:MAG: YtxH domain-containing protein [Flavobacteriales bacterium]|jgi:gas vesicle protein
MSTGKVILGALAGLAVGAIAGILLAPEKGSVTRKQIVDKGDDYLDEIKSKWNDFLESLSDKKEGVRKSAEDMADRGKLKYEHVENGVKEKASDYKPA